jgi:hypothetical protein
MHERAHMRTSLTERCPRIEQSDETYEGHISPMFPVGLIAEPSGDPVTAHRPPSS